MQNRLILSPKLKKALSVFCCAIALYIGMIVVLRALGLDNVKESLKSLGIWSPIVFVILCTISIVFAPLSSGSIFITGGLLFSQQTGFWLSLLSVILGCCINFWISRKLGRKVAARLLGRNSLRSLDRLTARLNSQHSILMMTLIMPLSQDLISYAIGLTKIRFLHFFVALLLSGVAVVGAYVYFGTEVIEGLL